MMRFWENLVSLFDSWHFLPRLQGVLFGETDGPHFLFSPPIVFCAQTRPSNAQRHRRVPLLDKIP